MKYRLCSLPTLRTALMQALLAFLLAATTPLLNHSIGRGDVANANAPSPFTTLWHAGTFRYLDVMSGDLITYVQGLPHPNNGGYGKLSSTRKSNFNAFLDALFAAIDASLADGNAGDWCGVKSKASAAGYAIYRFYDTGSGRWFVHSYDTTSFGQAYFFINPFAKRNIVIEVPHEGFDLGTGWQGAQIFKGLAARALIINKEHRCSDPDTSGCFLNYPAEVCDGRYRESDVNHHPDNTFHLLHMRYSDMDPVTNFVQLHGFGTSHGYNAEIADGTTRDSAPGSVSVVFANHLRSQIPAGDASLVLACQEFSDGMPPSGRSATKNLQGRYTNGPSGGGCLGDTSSYSGRFLHIEQAQTLRDDNNNDDGWYWADVMEAVRLTWGDCNMNNGSTDCTLGPTQTQYSTLSCSGVMAMNAK